MKIKRNIKKNIINNKKIIYSGIIGLSIGTLITLSFFPERIAKLENGEEIVVTTNNSTITAENLYESMKQEYAISTLLNTVDKEILNSKYTITEEMNTEIDETLEYYLNLYNSYYGYTEEEFLNANGFASKKDFKEYLTIDYLRNLYYKEYAKEQITEKEIKNYYKSDVFGSINTKYIAVDTNKDNAENLINEIINKLNDGDNYDDIVEKYKDSITHQELGYQSFDSSLSDTYLKALKKLKDNSYTKEYVTTDYGYTVIFRLDQQEKQELNDLTDTIREKLANDLMAEDEKLYYKVLIQLRKDNNIEFKDTIFEKKYKAYCKEFE